MAYLSSESTGIVRAGSMAESDTAGIDVTMDQRDRAATMPAVGAKLATCSPPKPGDFKLRVDCPEIAASGIKALEIDATIVVGGKKYDGKKFGDFELLSNIGNGAHGAVQKYRHKPSKTLMAIKRVFCSSNEKERTYVIRELEISRKLVGCELTVNFYGAFFRENEVWLCMELMDTSLYQFYKVLHKHHINIPEDILGKMAFSIISGLKYLHDALNVIHRDVKPSNILLNRAGNVKLCDYSIAGYLVKSLASTMDTGYVPYLAPERICPVQPVDPEQPITYDIRADVWSFGITMVEVATAKHPFSKDSKRQTMFDQMMEVIQGSSAIGLPPGQFSDEFTEFIDFCLKRSVAERPKYDALLQHQFMVHQAAAADSSDVMETFVKNHLTQFASEFSFHQDSKNN